MSLKLARIIMYARFGILTQLEYLLCILGQVPAGPIHPINLKTERE